jgi:hypothetical protein
VTLEDPFKFDHGLEYAVQIKRNGELNWQFAMQWVTKDTAIMNCKKLVDDGFMRSIRCVRLSRYPPWAICSVHFFWEAK